MSLPEDIENIEDFYRQELDGLAPIPNEMTWGKIKVGLQRKKMQNRIFTWGLSTASLMAIALIFYSYFHNSKVKNTPKKAPSVNFSSPVTPQENPSTESLKSTTTKIFSSPNTKPTKAEKLFLDKKEPVINSVMPEKDSSDTKKENASPTTEKEEKIAPFSKPASFIDKVKSKTKDSLRPIFVPKP